MFTTLRAQVLGLLALFGLLFAGFIGLVWRSTAERVEDSVYTGVLATKDLVADILPPPLFVVEAWLIAHQAVMAASEQEQQALMAKWEALEEAFRARQTFWRNHLKRPALQLRLDEALAAGQQFFVVGKARLWPAVREKNHERAQEVLLKELKPLFLQHATTIDSVVQLASEVEQQQRAEAAEQVRALKRSLVGIGIVGLIVALSIGLRIASKLRRRLNDLVGALAAAARGDLRSWPSAGERDEISVVHNALNETLASMARAIEQVQRVSRQVDTEANSLTEASGGLRSGVQDQAASSEETAASLEQLSANAQQTAHIAERGEGLANKSREAVSSTETVMQSTQGAMRALATTSSQVRDIIGTVDEMAFQTNLLALNAAVEAARAGDAGRGFAVVAHEVRSLAQRSAQASRDIRRLIEGAVNQVSESSSLVDRCSKSLTEARDAVTEVSGLMTRLASAAKEQSSGVAEINRASMQSDAFAQRAASRAQELTDASRRLTGSAAQLTKLASHFVTEATQAVDGMEAASESQPAFGVEPNVMEAYHPQPSNHGAGVETSAVA
jgi:methyl-accepting chemotaxis protein